MKKKLKIIAAFLFATCLALALTACGGLFGGSSSSSSIYDPSDGGSSSDGGGSSSDGGGPVSGGSQSTEDNDGTFIYTGSSVKAASTSISGDIVIPSEHNGNPIDTIPANAFKGCTGITSVTVPNEVTSIGANAFSGCSLLRSITLPFVGSQKGNNGEYAIFGYIFGSSRYQGGTSTLQRYGTGSSSYGYYYIPTTLQSVQITNESILGYGAFQNCTTLKTIDLNDGILQIGVNCFRECSRVEEISLPNVTALPNSAFRGCISLSTFTIGDSVDTIATDAFYACNALSSVNSETAGTFVIPDTVSSIGKGAFDGCSMIKNITLPFVGSQKGNDGEYAIFGHIFGSVSYQGGTSTEQRYGTGSSSYGYYYIPTTLQSVTITNERTLGYGAFQNCSMLKTIDLNDGIVQIGVNCFRGCSRVEEINLPNISILPGSAFKNCIALSTFTIGDSVDTIGSEAFNGCTALSSINSDTDGTFVIPDTVTFIGSSAFHGCIMMKSITLPFVGSQKGNTGEGAIFGYIFGSGSYQGGTRTQQRYGGGSSDYGIYYIPSALRSVTITGETVLSRGAFQNCSILQTLRINSGAQESIGTDALSNTATVEWI